MSERTTLAASAPSSPEAGSFRELWRVALPLMLSSGSLSLQIVIDRMYLTWYSNDALAASMPAGALHWTLLSIGIGTASYVNTFVAQYHGAGKKDRIAASVWQGVYFSLFAACVIGLTLPFSWWIFDQIGHEPGLRDLEGTYFAVLNGGAVFALLTAALSCFFSGRGATIVVLWANLAATAANAILDYFLIFGVGGWEGWGIAGAALATVAASVVSCAIYAALMLRGREGRQYAFLLNWRFDAELFRRLMRFGLPSGFHFFLDVICFSLFILLVGRLGTDDLAATSLAFNLNTLAFIPVFGLGTAVMTLVGQRVGEGRPELAVRTTWLAFAVSFVHMNVFSAVYFFAPDLILAPYAAKSDPAKFEVVREQVVVLLRFVALYGVFDAMNIVFGAAVRGAGDTRFSMLFSGACGWFCMVVPTYVALVHFGGGLLAAWGIVTFFLVVVGFGYMARFQQGKWKSMRVIEMVRPAELAEELAPTDSPALAPIPVEVALER